VRNLYSVSFITKETRIIKHWNSHRTSHWHQFRIALLILCRQSPLFLPCVGTKGAARFPARLLRPGEGLAALKRVRGVSLSSRRAVGQGPVPMAWRLFAVLPWRVCVCSEQLCKLRRVLV